MLRAAMTRDLFDRVARDYEAIHERSLPPGVHSGDFIRQRAAQTAAWIGEPAGEFAYLDFGCGNGRLFAALLESAALAAALAEGRLRVFGVDSSTASLAQARALAGAAPIGFAAGLDSLPPGLAFDLVTCFLVFHHIPPAARAEVARSLRARIKPGGRIVVWEHNPFNPFTRLLVRLCPFDGEARLLAPAALRGLLARAGMRLRPARHVCLVPPGWQRLRPLAALEAALGGLPLGAQYWVMGENA
jgi:SAM-dependent methyltransferase